MDRLAVNIEGEDFGERYTRAINSEIGEPARQRRRRAHGVASYASEGILLHRNERPASSPSGIALGIGQFLRSNEHVPNRRRGPTRKDAADARCACDRRRSDKQSAVRPNRGNHITRRSGKHEQLRRNLGDAYSFLSANRGTTVPSEGPTGLA